MYNQKMIMLIIGVLFLVGEIDIARSQLVEEDPAEMRGVTIKEHLGDTIPLDLPFVNTDGDTVLLGSYFNQGKPVLLNLVYYECPMLCTLVLNGLIEALQKVDWTPGEEFTMLTISIDQRETLDMALQKKYRYIEAFGKDISAGWHFHVGQDEQITPLAESLGFGYYYDEKLDQFVHPAASFLLAEDGRITRYLYGIAYEPRNVKLALLEASEGKVGSTLDKLILYCFHYDPDARGYVAFAQNIMKLGGLATLIVLSIFIGIFWARDRRRKAVLN